MTNTFALRRPVSAVIISLSLLLPCGLCAASDWPQWRGPERRGEAGFAGRLISLPVEGLRPVWKTTEPLAGGWGSPIVVAGRVYLLTHRSKPRKGVALPPPQFPQLSMEEKAAQSPEELQAYEASRSKESRERTRATTDFDDVLHCLDANSGHEIWVAQWPGRMVQWGQSSTPTAFHGTLYVVGSDREIHAISQEDGAHQWATTRLAADEVTEPVSSTIAVAGSTGVVLCDDLMGIDLRSGQILWEKTGGKFSGFHSSPVIHHRSGDHSTAIVNVRGGQTVGVDSATGEELWRLDSQAERSSPVIAGDRLVTYASSRKGGLRCYRLGDDAPEELWTWHRMADPGSTPAVTDDSILVAGDKVLSCLDLETGDPRWSERLDLAQSQYSSPIVMGDIGLYADQGIWVVDLKASAQPIRFEARFDEEGLLATPQKHRENLQWDAVNKVDPAKAEQLWQQRVATRGVRGCTSPAFANDHLFVRLTTGLACYRLSLDEAGGSTSQPTVSIP